MTRMILGLQKCLAAARAREEGQAMVEYALILALVSIAAIATLTLIGTEVDTVLTDVLNALTGA
jgi:pilus assembly protein Flp/PilA